MNKIIIFIFVLIIAAVATFFMSANQSVAPTTENNTNTLKNLNDNANVMDTEQQPGQLLITTIREGNGAQAQAGNTVSVHYVGTFEDGTTFDSSRDRGVPFSFTLGAGQVIKGWDIGVAGMKVGELRKLVIPYELGYGINGYRTIPPKATLIFEVELISVE